MCLPVYCAMLPSSGISGQCKEILGSFYIKLLLSGVFSQGFVELSRLSNLSSNFFQSSSVGLRSADYAGYVTLMSLKAKHLTFKEQCITCQPINGYCSAVTSLTNMPTEFTATTVNITVIHTASINKEYNLYLSTVS